MDELNPQAQAFERLGGRYDTRVLEPSPPAVNEPPWFADDPVARGQARSGRQVVSPVGTGDLRWIDLAVQDTQLVRWCEDRWLGPYKTLKPPPATLAQTRIGLHKLAEHLISPARRHANGKIGLRYTRGGFGTPFFGDDVQLRVQGTELVVQIAGIDRAAPITTLAAAAELVGADLLPDGIAVDEQPLQLDPDAARFIGEWFGFAASVLEELRAQAGDAAEPSRVQLWPEHFDIAIELGREQAGARAAYGLSPGDEQHPEPYIYVAPWVAPAPGELWQATGFNGAELAFGALQSAEDQREAALEFLRTRLAALTASRR